MERQIYLFDIRADAMMRLEEMVKRIEAAMGGEFRRDEYENVSAWSTDLLGMRVLVYELQRSGGEPVFRMHGRNENPHGQYGEYPNFRPIDLSQAMINELEARGAGKWRRPSEAEIGCSSCYGGDARTVFDYYKGLPIEQWLSEDEIQVRRCRACSQWLFWHYEEKGWEDQELFRWVIPVTEAEKEILETHFRQAFHGDWEHRWGYVKTLKRSRRHLFCDDDIPMWMPAEQL